MAPKIQHPVLVEKGLGNQEREGQREGQKEGERERLWLKRERGGSRHSPGRVEGAEVSHCRPEGPRRARINSRDTRAELF